MKNNSRRSRVRALFAGGAVVTLVFMMMALLAPVASAAPTTFLDDGGPDDQVGQKDLNSLTVDYGSVGATSIAISWTWDDTDFSGNNTGDACAEFDTDKDGKSNYAGVSELAARPPRTSTRPSGLAATVLQPSAPRQAATRPSRTPASRRESSGISQVQDPFGLGGIAFDANHSTDGGVCDGNPLCNSKDTQAAGTIQLADFGGATAKLINVCSHESASPTSNPEECIFAPNSGFLTIIKNASPNDSTSFAFTSSVASNDGDTSWSRTGSGTVASMIPFVTPINGSSADITTLNLNEAVPAGWSLDSAGCVIQSSPTAATGTPDAPPAKSGPTSKGVQNLQIHAGLETDLHLHRHKGDEADAR